MSTSYQERMEALSISEQMARQSTRNYHCRSCGKTEESALVPSGWYSLSRHNMAANSSTVRLGVYCSAACVAKSLPFIREREAQIG